MAVESSACGRGNAVGLPRSLYRAMNALQIIFCRVCDGEPVARRLLSELKNLVLGLIGRVRAVEL